LVFSLTGATSSFESLLDVCMAAAIKNLSKLNERAKWINFRSICHHQFRVYG
jgi:hypothetical protein